MSIYIAIAVLLFLANMERGRERMHFARCVRCNAHPWDRHAPGCPHKGRW